MVYHIAQMNTAYPLYPMDDPRMDGFMSQLDRINALADTTAGFVWRLQSDSGNATDIEAYSDGRLVNMSVWESIEALRDYSYQGDHVEIFKQRKLWFKKMDEAHQVLWWVPAGHLPTIAEGKARLAQLVAEGPTPDAFTFAKRFPPPDEG